ncbi:NUDIX domain-containing protein [uncultured Sphaerochaeta sp.]|jgi:predicted NUDIX family phosphoesterase|uniref:NUDIX domain-containing protein n=1 Tax=uncultured Sphaerochaeta sp. TaxID=886478 RepID=UPI0026298A44|nr:NUDIX domain-containing protein [uncultured Sphaerochaeta sp.]
MSICCIEKQSIDESWWTDTYYTENTFLNDLRVGDLRWLPRSRVEDDPSYKQLIPYVLVKSSNNAFACYQRAGTEIRLHAFMSCGVGGHIEEVDKRETVIETVLAGARRELSEEFANYQSNIGRLQIIGVIHENETEVGLHHIGIVLLLQLGETESLCPDLELKDCVWLSRDQLLVQRLELWSKLALQLEETVCLIP